MGFLINSMSYADRHKRWPKNNRNHRRVGENGDLKPPRSINASQLQETKPKYKQATLTSKTDRILLGFFGGITFLRLPVVNRPFSSPSTHSSHLTIRTGLKMFAQWLSVEKPSHLLPLSLSQFPNFLLRLQHIQKVNRDVLVLRFCLPVERWTH